MIKAGNWIPIELDELAEVFALVPRPWPRTVAVLDLRRAQDQALAAGKAFPSLNALAERWGWDGTIAGAPKKASVRALLAREPEWSDPRKQAAWDLHPRSAERSKERTHAQGTHSQDTGDAQCTHAERTNETGEAGQLCRSAHTGHTTDAQCAHSERTAGATDARSPTPTPSTDKKNSPQPPAERGASDPGLVEAVVALLLDHGPMTVEVEAEQMRRLLSRDAATGERLRKKLKARNDLPTGMRSTAVADACPEAAALWVARRTWTPGEAQPSPSADDLAMAEGFAVAERLRLEAEERDQRAAERSAAEEEARRLRAEREAVQPEDPPWVEQLAAELADAWERTKPPVGDQLRAGHGPALLELRKGLYARGRLAIGTSLKLVERAVKLAFEQVDARQSAAVEAAA